MEHTQFRWVLQESAPSHFYKFRSVNEFTRKIIVDRALFFNSANEFNDPFDFLPKFSMDADKASLRTYFETVSPDRTRSGRRAFAAQTMKDRDFHRREQESLLFAYSILDEVRLSTGIMCLAARADHMLLWGHYADAHKGIALRFKPQKGDGYFEEACQVAYQKERPTVNLVSTGSATRYKLGLLTKADFWSYEEEWRIIRADRKGSQRFPASSLDGILLGAKIQDQDEQRVRDWVAQSGLSVEWLRAKVHAEEFRLEIVAAT